MWAVVRDTDVFNGEDALGKTCFRVSDLSVDTHLICRASLHHTSIRTSHEKRLLTLYAHIIHFRFSEKKLDRLPVGFISLRG